MVKTRIEVFPEIRDHIDFFETLPEYDIAMYTHKKMKTNAETSLKVLKDVLPILEAQEDFSNDALFAALSAYVSETGVKTGFVMWPVRTAAVSYTHLDVYKRQDYRYPGYHRNCAYKKS